MSSLKQMKYTDSAGKETIVDLAVNAANIENNTFTQAAARANIKTGDTLPTIWGKLAKWFADLKTVAWSGKYTDLTDKPALGTSATHNVANNCSTTAANFVLDARQGQALQSTITQVDSRLTTSINQVSSNVTGLSGVVSPYLTGCVMTCDGANFYAHWGGLKKKLGDYTVTILDGSHGSQNSFAQVIPGGLKFMLTSISNYQSLELFRNIFPVITGHYSKHTGATSGPTYNYTPTTGTLTMISGNASIGYPNYAILYVIQN